MCENAYGGRFVHQAPLARQYDGPTLGGHVATVEPDCRADTVLSGLPVTDHAADIEAEVKRRLEARRCGRACERPTCKEERALLAFRCGPDETLVPCDPRMAALVTSWGFPATDPRRDAWSLVAMDASGRLQDLLSTASFMGYDVVILSAV